MQEAIIHIFCCVCSLRYFALIGLPNTQKINFSFGIDVKFEIGYKIAPTFGLELTCNVKSIIFNIVSAFKFFVCASIFYKF